MRHAALAATNDDIASTYAPKQRRLRCRRGACPAVSLKGGHPVAQRSIEILIGQLLTDESFRSAFLRERMTTLQRFNDAGYPLTELEIDAITRTSPDLWHRVAHQIDARLQKACLRSEASGEKP
jgi:hypothetical protein